MLLPVGGVGCEGLSSQGCARPNLSDERLVPEETLGCCGWQARAMGPGWSPEGEIPLLVSPEQSGVFENAIVLGQVFPSQHKPGNSASFLGRDPKVPSTSRCGGEGQSFPAWSDLPQAPAQ